MASSYCMLRVRARLRQKYGMGCSGNFAIFSSSAFIVSGCISSMYGKVRETT